MNSFHSVARQGAARLLRFAPALRVTGYCVPAWVQLCRKQSFRLRRMCKRCPRFGVNDVPGCTHLLPASGEKDLEVLAPPSGERADYGGVARCVPVAAVEVVCVACWLLAGGG